MTVFDPNIFLSHELNLGLGPKIRIGSGFCNSLDRDPDSAKCLDQDSVNPDPKHR
jgi:hypothetical protein